MCWFYFGVDFKATLACYSATLAITVSQQTIIKPAESRMIIMRFRNDAAWVQLRKRMQRSTSPPFSRTSLLWTSIYHPICFFGKQDLHNTCTYVCQLAQCLKWNYRSRASAFTNRVFPVTLYSIEKHDPMSVQHKVNSDILTDHNWCELSPKICN